MSLSSIKTLSTSAKICYNISSAAIAQLVERIHGKDEVLGSNPSRGSILHPNCPKWAVFVIMNIWQLLVSTQYQNMTKQK